MSYATPQDMIDRFGAPRMLQLTDRADPPAGVADLVLLQRHLDDASAVVDGYLVGRYTLPLDVMPAVLKVHTCTLAYRSLLGESADEPLLKDCQAIHAYLGKVAAGQVALMPPQVAAAVGAGDVFWSPGTKVMGRDELDPEESFWG